MRSLLQFLALCATVSFCICYDGTERSLFCHSIPKLYPIPTAIHHLCITWFHVFPIESRESMESTEGDYVLSLIHEKTLHAVILTSTCLHHLQDMHAWPDQYKDLCLVTFWMSRFGSVSKPSKLIHYTSEGTCVQPLARRRQDIL